MKVFFLIDSLAPGGTETSTVVLAGRLATCGMQPTIVTLRVGDHDLTEQAEAAGVPVERLSSTSFYGRVHEFRRLITQRGADVVHTALFTADQIGRLAAWRTGVPVVSSFVNTPYDDSRLSDPNVSRWKMRVIQVIDAVTGRWLVAEFHAVSEGVKRANARALRLPVDRITVAERGRDPDVLGARTKERRDAVRVKLGIPADAPVVLSLGRQDHQKGHRVLIEATATLDPRYPDLVVLIAGKRGSASEELERLLDDRPTAARHVRMLGHRSDVGDLLCAADVLAISSYFEGTAGVALEAMALETPIVSTDLDGMQGIVADGSTGVLVPVGDPSQLGRGIARVLDDEELANRLATSGRREYLDRFTLDAATRRLGDLYAGLGTRP